MIICNWSWCGKLRWISLKHTVVRCPTPVGPLGLLRNNWSTKRGECFEQFLAFTEESQAETKSTKIHGSSTKISLLHQSCPYRNNGPYISHRSQNRKETGRFLLPFLPFSPYHPQKSKILALLMSIPGFTKHTRQKRD